MALRALTLALLPGAAAVRQLGAEHWRRLARGLLASPRCAPALSALFDAARTLYRMVRRARCCLFRLNTNNELNWGNFEVNDRCY
jgi:hypothetical protein